MRHVCHDITCPYCGGDLEHQQKLQHQPSRAVDTLTCLHRECRRQWAYVRELALIGRNNGCGTDAGYQQHVRDAEPPCDPCRAAHAETMRRYRRRPTGTP